MGQVNVSLISLSVMKGKDGERRGEKGASKQIEKGL